MTIVWKSNRNPGAMPKLRADLPFGQPLGYIKTEKGYVEFRRYKPSKDKSKGITKLRNASFGKLPMLHYPPYWLTHDKTEIYEFLRGKNDLIVAAIEGKIVGCAAFLARPYIGDGVAEFRKFMVHPKYSGLGIGKKLIEIREQLAVDENHNFKTGWMDTTTVQQASLQMHLKMGWHYANLAELAKEGKFFRESNPWIRQLNLHASVANFIFKLLGMKKRRPFHKLVYLQKELSQISAGSLPDAAGTRPNPEGRALTN